MRRSTFLLPVLAAFAAVLGAPSGARAEDAPKALEHAIRAELDPEAHGIAVVDEITLPSDAVRRFRLHAGLTVEALDASAFSVHEVPDGKDAGSTGSGEEGQRHALRIKLWELRPKHAGADGPQTALLRMAGTIHHPLRMESQEYARSFSRTPGTIDAKGVFLGGASWWLPRFGDELVTYTLTVSLPEGWDAVSQGARAGARTEGGRRVVVWSCKHPMDEVYLIANRFHEYASTAGAVKAYAFLRSPDENLANKYLEVTAQYIEMYRKLIGRYPFEKFALIENFWETGYGMPSFTLLGPRVIRFPFILHSSYPHEILHNWWGNSVYVDWQTGNWCEGLTAYLADHLNREGQGRGVEYRQDTLKGYRDYVKGGKDFPLTDFRSRHSAATQAIGYGKCLMLFHMLRRDLGDALFQRCLQRFYRKQQFTRAAWADIRAVFSETAERDLGPFFAQWVQRTGAPELALDVKFAGEGTLVVEIQQLQEGEPYALNVPLAVTLAGKADAHVETVALTKRSQQVALQVEGTPVRVDLDPQFDVFRRLHRKEIPATLSQMFGAEKVTLVLPEAGAAHAAGWAEFAKAWSRGGTVEIVKATDLTSLPPDRAVWVLGATNPAAQALAPALRGQAAGLDDAQIHFGAVKIPRKDHSFVYVVRHPANEELAIGWVGTDVAAALPGLARKLPHYGKYSHLGFHGAAPDNVAKGRWSTVGSPLSVTVGERAEPVARGTLPARTPLGRLAPVFDAKRLMGHVRWLAAPEREGRGAGSKGLDESADYIAAALKHAGLQPGGDDGTFFQTFTAENGPDGKPVVLRNVVGVLPGTNPAMDGQSVVLGAHYDHLGRGWPDHRAAAEKGEIYNGADDNASGVAVLLELAQLLGKQHKPSRSIVFVAFTGEEWGLKGSKHYVATQKRWPVSKALAMVNMDTVGRLDGKKIQLLGSGTATEWRHIAMGVGFTTGVESQCIADDPGGSDQGSFVAAGVPGVQVFSGAHADYHRPSDDIEKIDAEGLVQVATFVRETLVYLGERPEPLTTTLKAGGGPKPAAKKGGGRRVSFGTMPAFDFRGPGVKVADVIGGSPAAKAGIQKGDILLALDGGAMKDLRAFSDLLRAHAPGDIVNVTIRRGNEEFVSAVTLGKR